MSDKSSDSQKHLPLNLMMESLLMWAQSVYGPDCAPVLSIAPWGTNPLTYYVHFESETSGFEFESEAYATVVEAMGDVIAQVGASDHDEYTLTD
jgi:hypothetical protein